MAFELLLRSRSDDKIGYLRRKETPQSPHVLDFTHLVGDTLFKLLVELVEIVEQPRILDGYDRLRSKISDQLDLLVGERPDFSTIDNERTD